MSHEGRRTSISRSSKSHVQEIGERFILKILDRDIDRYYKIKITPNVGLEPTTVGLRVQRSTDWASRACWNIKFVLLYSKFIFKRNICRKSSLRAFERNGAPRQFRFLCEVFRRGYRCYFLPHRHLYRGFFLSSSKLWSTNENFFFGII